MKYPAYLSTLEVVRRLRKESSERLLYLRDKAASARLRLLAGNALRWRNI